MKNHIVFQYFNELCKIPRGSGNRKPVSDFIVRFAKAHGLDYRQDGAYNVVVFKPAAAGLEQKPAVMLQGHMDMVCEKTPDSAHCFETDPIIPVYEGEYLHAQGTTLGADNGIAAAYMMALLADSDMALPALECVFTTDEEIGLLGAAALEPYPTRAEYLINLDNEEEHHFCVSCAGGRCVHITAQPETARLPLAAEEPVWVYELTISGLCGGHSGVEIQKEGANANKLLGRLLFELASGTETEAGSLFHLISFHGGQKDNVIPNGAKAVLAADSPKLTPFLQERFAVYRHEYAGTEREMRLDVECRRLEEPAAALTPTETMKLLFFLVQADNGVVRMDHEIEGLVQTSCNLGIVDLEAASNADCDSRLSMTISVRSNIGTRKEELSQKLSFLASFLGYDAAYEGDYPQWEYRRESSLRTVMERVHMEMYGTAPKWEAIHAGLECGIFANKFPELDIVSIGPTLLDIHTPKERAEIPSVVRCYEYLCALLTVLGSV